MSLILAKTEVAGATISYGAVGAYAGSFNFTTDGASVSSISAVNVTALTLGTSASPTVQWNISGSALPRLLVMDALGVSESLSYTFTGDNNFLHIPTLYANLTSSLVAVAVLSADTETEGVSSFSGTSFQGNLFTFAGDAGAPDPVTYPIAVGGDRVVTLTWVNPVYTDVTSIKINQSTVSAVTSVGFGDEVFSTTTLTTSSASITVPVLGSEVYYFGIYTTDNVGQTSTVASVSPSAVPTFLLWANAIEHGNKYIQGLF